MEMKPPWDNLFLKVKTLLIEKDADGVGINFENLPPSKRSNLQNLLLVLKNIYIKSFMQ